MRYVVTDTEYPGHPWFTDAKDADEAQSLYLESMYAIEHGTGTLSVHPEFRIDRDRQK